MGGSCLPVEVFQETDMGSENLPLVLGGKKTIKPKIQMPLPDWISRYEEPEKQPTSLKVFYKVGN